LTDQVVQGWEPTAVYANLAKLRADAGAAEVCALREMATKRNQEHDVLVRQLTAFHAGGANDLGTLMRRYNSPGGMSVGPYGMHIIFCLDESGSMSGSPWTECVSAFQSFWQQAAADQSAVPMHVSVVQFGTTARVTVNLAPLQGGPPALSPHFTGTCFDPPIVEAEKLMNHRAGPSHGYTTVVVFMSDGCAGDVARATSRLERLAQQHMDQFASYTVGFGSSAPRTLEKMAFSNGLQTKDNYRAANVGNLTEAFTAIATAISPGRL